MSFGISCCIALKRGLHDMEMQAGGRKVTGSRKDLDGSLALRNMHGYGDRKSAVFNTGEIHDEG